MEHPWHRGGWRCRGSLLSPRRLNAQRAAHHGGEGRGVFLLLIVLRVVVPVWYAAVGLWKVHRRSSVAVATAAVAESSCVVTLASEFVETADSRRREWAIVVVVWQGLLVWRP